MIINYNWEIEPKDLCWNIKERVYNNIRDHLKNTIIPGIGYIIDVNEVYDVTSLPISNTNNKLIFQTKINVNVFTPRIKEVIPITIERVNDIGVIGKYYRNQVIVSKLHNYEYDSDRMCYINVDNDDVLDIDSCVNVVIDHFQINKTIYHIQGSLLK